MSINKNQDVDPETILMTLDQIGQTIDVMTNVVGRLRGYITEQIDQPTATISERDETISITHKNDSQIIH